jgi:two-component system, chemotaxis family, chemotaxis protein CheY
VKPVLIVDDSQTVRRDIATALNAAGITTLEAADGEVGLDVNMPRMNGLQMLEHLRLDFATANVPVVILTTEADETMIERARKAGAKGWLIKPVTAEHIVSTVVAVAERVRP